MDDGSGSSSGYMDDDANKDRDVFASEKGRAGTDSSLNPKRNYI